MKQLRTALDDEFEEALDKVAKTLIKINQKAIRLEENDVQRQSCSIFEHIDSILAARKEEE